jgi:hypothetical protein
MKRSEETRKKISDSMKGNQKWLGKKHSEETKILISKAKAGKDNLKARKPIKANKVGCSDYIYFSGLLEASKALGIGASGISMCCTGKKSSARGYEFRFTSAQELGVIFYVHNVEFSGTPAASSPEAPLERRVGPGAQED